nr:MAG TPA_asm: hypothetical protein [Caudoviricetes sp.]
MTGKQQYTNTTCHTVTPSHRHKNILPNKRDYCHSGNVSFMTDMTVMTVLLYRGDDCVSDG